MSSATSIGMAKKAHEAAGAAVDLGVDAHHFTAHVEERPARVAGVDRDVGLNEGDEVLLRQRAALALTMPAVTVFSKPNGEPIATTHSPTLSLFGSPKRTAGRPVASILITAMSVRRSAPITLALNSRLSVKRTLISSAPSMTCALVRM